MANPGFGFLFLIGVGIFAAVGLLFANQNRPLPETNSRGSRNSSEPNTSWTTGNEEKKNRRGRRKSVCEKDCSICYSTEKKCDYKTKCGHYFHLECLSKWVEIEKTCPYCRRSLIDTFL